MAPKQRRNLGPWRGTFAQLLDDLDFQDLSPEARHVYHVLRLSRLNTCAGIYLLAHSLVIQHTGYPSETMEIAFEALVRGGWIVFDPNQRVVWLRNQLRFDPNISLDNPNHRKGILAVLDSLPNKCSLINQFREYYDLQQTRPSEDPPKATRRPSEAPSKQGEGEGKGKRKGEGQGEGKTGEPEGGKRRSHQGDYSEAFNAFWTNYPRKVGKGKAYTEWKKAGADKSQALASAIIVAVDAAKTSEQWNRSRGQFIPHPATYLHQRRWEDTPEPPGGLGSPESATARWQPPEERAAKANAEPTPAEVLDAFDKL